MWAGTQRDRRVAELAGGSDTGGGRARPALRRVRCSRRPLCHCRLNPVLASSACVAAAAASEDRHTPWPRPPHSEGLTCWAPAEARHAGPHSRGPDARPRGVPGGPRRAPMAAAASRLGGPEATAPRGVEVPGGRPSPHLVHSHSLSRRTCFSPVNVSFVSNRFPAAAGRQTDQITS